MEDNGPLMSGNYTDKQINQFINFIYVYYRYQKKTKTSLISVNVLARSNSGNYNF